MEEGDELLCDGINLAGEARSLEKEEEESLPSSDNERGVRKAAGSAKGGAA